MGPPQDAGESRSVHRVEVENLVKTFPTVDGGEKRALADVTFHVGEAETLCDRIGLLHEGRLIAEGDLPSLQHQSGCSRLTEIFLELTGQRAASLLGPSAAPAGEGRP